MHIFSASLAVPFAVSCAGPESAPTDRELVSPSATAEARPIADPKPTETEPPPEPPPIIVSHTDPPKLPGDPVPTQISVGDSHACARMSDDTARCWGANGSGQIGDGVMRSDADEPATVSGLDNIVEIAAGESFTCARLRDRSVWCWGGHAESQLGTGEIGGHREPRPVQGLDHVIELSAADNYACGRRDDRTVWCWGDNTWSQLGDSTTEARTGPVKVVGLSDALQVDASDNACVRRAGQGLGCWGMNQNKTMAALPLENVVDVSAGLLGCAVLEDGSVHCWGPNNSGQLGREADNEHLLAPTPIPGLLSTPTPIPGLTEVVAVSTSTTHACALKTDGQLFCWGKQSANPQGFSRDCLRMTQNSSGGGSAAQWKYCATPTRVPGLKPVSQIATNYFQLCALTTDHQVWCWGEPKGRVRHL